MKRSIFIAGLGLLIAGLVFAGSYKRFEPHRNTGLRGNIIKVIDSTQYEDSVFQDTFYSDTMTVSDPSNVTMKVSMVGFTHADSAIDSVGFISVSLFGAIDGQIPLELKNDTFPDAYSATDGTGFDSTDTWTYYLGPDTLPLNQLWFRFIWFDSVMSDTGNEAPGALLDSELVRITAECSAK